MTRNKYYILAWHDEGETNRAEKIWEGHSASEAMERFYKAEFSDDVYFIEVWKMNPEEDEEVRLNFRTAETIEIKGMTFRIENNDGILEYFANGHWVFAVKEEDPIDETGLRSLLANGYFDEYKEA